MNPIRRMGMVAAIAVTSAAAAPVIQDGPGVTTVVVRVGDAEIRALCTDGPRQALLLHDAGHRADRWRPVLESLDGRVGACAYDRVPEGRPPATAATRGWLELEDQLRRIHAALDFEPGYTLVGHAVGGWYARLFAADRPMEVGALVLVEPEHEDMPEEMRPGMPHGAAERWMHRRQQPNADGVRESEVAERARRSRLPAIPVTVLTATRRADGSGFDERFLNQAARRVHASVLNGVSAARHVPAARSGPDIHLDQPDLVADEIVRVVRATRRMSR